MKTKYTIGGIVAALIMAVGMMTLPGCTAPSNTPSLLQSGAETATALGLTAISDPVEAKTIATLASSKIGSEILPILNGDDAGIIAGLNDILNLKVFSDPSLAKFKLIMQSVMPMLQAVLPPNLLSSGTNKIPADIKADLIGFFTGVKGGCDNYIASGKASAVAGKTMIDYNKLRKELNAK